MDNIVSFLRGEYKDYDSQTMTDGIYFARDKQILILNGIEYGGLNEATFDGIIKDVSINGDTLKFNRYISGKWSSVTITLLDAVDNSIELDTITSKDGETNGSTIRLKAVYDTDTDGDGLKLTDDGVKVVLDSTRRRLAVVEEGEKANSDAITILNGDATVKGSVANTVNTYIEAFEVDGGDY